MQPHILRSVDATAQARTHNRSVTWPHGGQSHNAAPPQKIQEECFHPVLHMVSYGDCLCAFRIGKIGKPPVTKFAAGGLHTFSMRFSATFHIEVTHVQVDAYAAVSSLQKSMSRRLSSPRKWKLQWAATHMNPRRCSAEAAPPSQRRRLRLSEWMRRGAGREHCR